MGCSHNSSNINFAYILFHGTRMINHCLDEPRFSYKFTSCVDPDQMVYPSDQDLHCFQGRTNPGSARDM